jgi:hypothetical protein
MGRARRIRSVSVLSVVTALTALVMGANPVLGQTSPAAGAVQSPGAAGSQVGVVAPQPAQPAPEFGFEPAIPLEQGTPRSEDYGERTRSVYQPAFVKGAVKTTRTSRTSGVRVGLSAWTGDRIPFDFRESSGFPAFGLTIQWGAPMEEPAEPAPPAER